MFPVRGGDCVEIIRKRQGWEGGGEMVLVVEVVTMIIMVLSERGIYGQ